MKPRTSILLTFIVVLLVFSNIAAAQSVTKTVTVPSTQPWTDTGLTVSAGDVISITASGTVTWDSSNIPTGPDGTTNPSGGCNYVVTNPSVPAQSLIGNIADSSTLDGQGFFVGSNFRGTVPIANTTKKSGKLFLSFNDGAVSCDRRGYDSWGFGEDNHGSFTAKITIFKRGDIEAFVTRFYKICLGRQPDTGGLNNWVDSLLDGTIAGADVAYGFVFSGEFISYDYSDKEYVMILYEAFFNRAPDPSGYNNWISALNSGYNRQYVLDGFIYSTEFSNLCSTYGIEPFLSGSWVTSAVIYVPQDFCSGWTVRDGTEVGNPPTCQSTVYNAGSGSLLISRDNLDWKILPTPLKGQVEFTAWALPATDSNTNFSIRLGDSSVQKDAIVIRVNETNRWFANSYVPEVPVANYSMDWTKIRLSINTVQNKFSLWLDDVLVVQDKSTQASLRGGINSIGLHSGRGAQPHNSYMANIWMLGTR